MGCCFSTTTATKSPPLKTEPNYQNAPTHRHRHEPTSRVLPSKQRDPPPPVVDQEESVKEVVLSETLISKPAQTTTTTTTHEPVEEISAVQEEKGNVHLASTNKKLKTQEEHIQVSEVSLVSESCERELSESLSYASLSTTATTATTTTVTEVKDDNDEAVSKRKRDSGARPRRAAAPGGSPSAVARRKRSTPSEISTLRGRGNLTSAAERRRVGARAAGVRREIGEVSARRSRSPATGRAGGTGRGVVGRGGSSVTSRGGGRSSAVVGKEEGSSETLENPLVALECFIFV